ncbi:hypothetical protein BDZ89DRAFT_22182 [Hymenopellis radicata]|nr:hypothetical protein BDZ89DRAFT_22182 [Hymenopellis radicata]
MSSTALQNDYTRLLYPVARGYTPLYPDAFQPHPSNEFILEGVQIGDLVLRDSIGSVLYIGINITKPADDPRNWQKLPKDYESLLLEPGIDYTVETSHFPSPGILHTTNSVSESFDLRHIPQAGNDTLEKLEFSTSATAGAYCGLPFGGSSHECTPVGLKKVQAFALRHGRSWYHQAIHVDSLDLQNGDLCVVTGCVKASYWMSGLFLSATPNSRFTKRLLVPKVEEGIVQPVRMLENCEEGTTPTILDYSLQSGRKHTANRFAKQTSCIAFRGFHISLGAPIYNDMRRPWTTRQRLWHALPRILRPPMKTWPIFEHQIPPYHPCIAINDLVLSSNRKIKTAVVHDADILSVIQPVRSSC